MQSCLPSQELVSAIDPLVYLVGAWEPFLSSLGPSDLESPSKSDLVVCRSSSPHACDSSLIDSSSPSQNLHRHMEYGHFSSPFGTIDPPCSCDFSNIEFPSDESILELMTTYCIPWEYLHYGLHFLPFWETFEVEYRRDSW